MIVFLIIYLLGAIATLTLKYLVVKRDSEGYPTSITLEEVIIGFALSLFSWCSFFVILCENFGDTVLFRINKNKSW